MATDNNFSVTQLISRTAGTYIHQNSAYMLLGYHGLPEFERNKPYAPGRQLSFKIPGVRLARRGLSYVPPGVNDKVHPYTAQDEDIFTSGFEFSISEEMLDIVGGKLAFTQNPTRDPDSGKRMNPQAKSFIDNYAREAYVGLIALIEEVMAQKATNAICYTPVDTPAKLSQVNAYADISDVDGMMDELGWLSARGRYGIMNVTDKRQVANSLQNTFVNSVNEPVTRANRVGGGSAVNKTSKSYVGYLSNINLYYSNSIVSTETGAQYLANPDSSGVTVSSYDPATNILVLAGVENSTAILFPAGSKISIPAIKWLRKAPKTATTYNLVLSVATDASGDGAGNVSLTVGNTLFADDEHANVTSLPANGDPVLVYPGMNHNHFFVPMGIICNSLPLGKIAGADNGMYTDPNTNCSVHTYFQGVAREGQNDMILRMFVPTLGVSDYLLDLPSPLPN